MSEPAITASQVRAIHAAKSRLGMEDAEYRDLLRRRYGVGTCKGLSRRQAGDLLAAMGRPLPRRPERRGHVGREAPGKAAPNVVKLASRPQRELIGELAERVGWREADGLSRWLLKSQGIAAVRTAAEAAAAIEGLKAMLRRAGRYGG